MTPKSWLSWQDLHSFVYDAANNRIRTFEDGVVGTSVATGIPGSRGDGGKALEAELETPQKLAFEEHGHLMRCRNALSDRLNHHVRQIDRRGVNRSVAGSGEPTGTTHELVGQ